MVAADNTRLRCAKADQRHRSQRIRRIEAANARLKEQIKRVQPMAERYDYTLRREGDQWRMVDERKYTLIEVEAIFKNYDKHHGTKEPQSAPDHGSSATATGADGASTVNGGIPFMITLDMKARLQDALGYSPEEIRDMTPTHFILKEWDRTNSVTIPEAA